MLKYPQPEAVFRYFSEIASMPHGSGHTELIRQWALDTAKRLGLEAYADETGNVIIRKDASAGYENHPRVILQGHMDMVCAQLPDCRKNMETEGLDLLWGDEYLSADGTTLGGDDGIAIAYAFAVLESDLIPHPPLTAVITVDEETGMDGATGLSPDALDGTYLINIDSEDEGIFTVGCAGGVRSHLCYPVHRSPAKGTLVSLSIFGLTGGHSGTEIHKPLLNANTLMLQLLQSVPQALRLCAWEGGVRDNVIPTACNAEVVVPDDEAEAFLYAVTCKLEQIKADYPHESGISLQTSIAPNCEPFAVEDTDALLDALALLPNGVQKMNERLGMPQTSLNLGIFTLEEYGDSLQVDALIRSGSNAEKRLLADRLRQLAEQAGGSASESGDYPAWEYVPDTALEQTAVKVFCALYGGKPKIETIHAGLECGILNAKAPQLQCISIGPDLLDIHTPRERLSIASAARTWEFLLALLKAL
ncbi:MAG: beta-Ala-His dipeptidase [Oscillospiraceae bacterium]|nr:beta-Ala-His dipeptidase [Oscillospiraceae bacterium]